jgi:hypothetical protein
MSSDRNGEIASRILAFLREIGLPVTQGGVNDETFLPGIEVVGGGLVVDDRKLLYPGDLLHEAGHLAVSPAESRPHLSGKVDVNGEKPQLVELEAMLWSYAACIHLGIDPRVVFHEYGYHGRSESLLQNFDLGVFIGVQGLEAAGMTLSPADAARIGVQPFPAMKKWLRD